MIQGGRRKSITFFITLGACLVTVILLLYVGWVLLNWRTGVPLAIGILLLFMLIAGVIVNTIYLVREIQRNAQHDAFINAVTHELKTPIASIQLYLQTLQSRPVGDDKRQDFYRTMVEDCERLLSTVEQVLHAGRIGRQQRQLYRTPIDLPALAEACADRARKLHHLPSGALECVHEGKIMVLGDEYEVRAAVSNLIDNAVKYSGRDIKIRVETASNGRLAAVRVSDRGVGIPENELKRVFKRFYRVPGPWSSRVKGTGLGLYIVRSVAKSHGGKAWAESEGPGHGSTFVLQLPVMP